MFLSEQPCNDQTAPGSGGTLLRLRKTWESDDQGGDRAQHDGRASSVGSGPRHETAWALTVHRSQGSEFDAVLLVLPRTPHELVTPELVYTGVTRARSRVLVVADDVVVRAACKARDPRRTGLFEKLRSH